MENHEIELITDEMMKKELEDHFEVCSPGWCGPVDGYLLDGNDEDE
jgi:hypothetical protein